MAGRQLTPFSLLIPAWLVWTMSGWKGVRGCWPAILVCGGVFAAIQFVVSNYLGPAMVNVFGGIGALVAMTLLLRFWQPKEVWRFADHDQQKIMSDQPLPSRRQIVYAWMPWVLLSVMIFLWGLPSWKTMLEGGSPEQPNALQGITKVRMPVPALDGRVYRTAPVVEVPKGLRSRREGGAGRL